ncbi:hypothetical protein D3C81_2145450 [compost metagenome]
MFVFEPELALLYAWIERVDMRCPRFCLAYLIFILFVEAVADALSAYTMTAAPLMGLAGSLYPTPTPCIPERLNRDLAILCL